MKTISAGTYLPILQALILDGKTVCLNISGSSMAPFLIHQRDAVRLQRPEHPPISGDIVLYQRENGQFILHRICRIKNGFYYLAGDNQTVLEGPVPPKQIFAVVKGSGSKQKIPDGSSLPFSGAACFICGQFFYLFTPNYLNIRKLTGQILNYQKDVCQIIASVVSYKRKGYIQKSTVFFE